MSFEFKRSDQQQHKTSTSTAEQAKAINSAFVSTIEETLQFSNAQTSTHELSTLMKTPAFEAILRATQDLSVSQNISEQEAALQVVRTFRRVEKVWNDYVLQIGYQSIRDKMNSH